MAVLRLALLLAACAGAVGCFSPHTPPCAFSCVDDGLCPAGFTCADDGVCHRDDGQGVCDIPPQLDAGPDAASDATASSDTAGSD